MNGEWRGVAGQVLVPLVFCVLCVGPATPHWPQHPAPPKNTPLAFQTHQQLPPGTLHDNSVLQESYPRSAEGDAGGVYEEKMTYKLIKLHRRGNHQVSQPGVLPRTVPQAQPCQVNSGCVGVVAATVSPGTGALTSVGRTRTARQGQVSVRTSQEDAQVNIKLGDDQGAGKIVGGWSVEVELMEGALWPVTGGPDLNPTSRSASRPPAHHADPLTQSGPLPLPPHFSLSSITSTSPQYTHTAHLHSRPHFLPHTTPHSSSQRVDYPASTAPNLLLPTPPARGGGEAPDPPGLLSRKAGVAHRYSHKRQRSHLNPLVLRQPTQGKPRPLTSTPLAYPTHPNISYTVPGFPPSPSHPPSGPLTHAAGGPVDPAQLLLQDVHARPAAPGRPPSSVIAQPSPVVPETLLGTTEAAPASLTIVRNVSEALGSSPLPVDPISALVNGASQGQQLAPSPFFSGRPKRPPPYVFTTIPPPIAPVNPASLLVVAGATTRPPITVPPPGHNPLLQELQKLDIVHVSNKRQPGSVHIPAPDLFFTLPTPSSHPSSPTQPASLHNLQAPGPALQLNQQGSPQTSSSSSPDPVIISKNIVILSQGIRPILPLPNHTLTDDLPGHLTHLSLPSTPSPHLSFPSTPSPHHSLPSTPSPHHSLPSTPSPHLSFPFTPSPHLSLLNIVSPLSIPQPSSVPNTGDGLAPAGQVSLQVTPLVPRPPGSFLPSLHTLSQHPQQSYRYPIPQNLNFPSFPTPGPHPSPHIPFRNPLPSYLQYPNPPFFFPHPQPYPQFVEPSQPAPGLFLGTEPGQVNENGAVGGGGGGAGSTASVAASVQDKTSSANSEAAGGGGFVSSSTLVVRGGTSTSNNNFFRLPPPAPSEGVAVAPLPPSLPLPPPSRPRPTIIVDGVVNMTALPSDVFPGSNLNVACSRRHGCPTFILRRRPLSPAPSDMRTNTQVIDEEYQSRPAGNINIACDFQHGCPTFIINTTPRPTPAPAPVTTSAPSPPAPTMALQQDAVLFSASESLPRPSEEDLVEAITLVLTLLNRTSVPQHQGHQHLTPDIQQVLQGAGVDGLSDLIYQPHVAAPPINPQNIRPEVQVLGGQLPLVSPLAQHLGQQGGPNYHVVHVPQDAALVPSSLPDLLDNRQTLTLNPIRTQAHPVLTPLLGQVGSEHLLEDSLVQAHLGALQEAGLVPPSPGPLPSYTTETAVLQDIHMGGAGIVTPSLVEVLGLGTQRVGEPPRPGPQSHGDHHDHRHMMRHVMAAAMFGIPTATAFLAAMGAPAAVIVPLGLAIPAILAGGFMDVNSSGGGFGSHFCRPLHHHHHHHHTPTHTSTPTSQNGGNGEGNSNTAAQLSGGGADEGGGTGDGGGGMVGAIKRAVGVLPMIAKRVASKMGLMRRRRRRRRRRSSSSGGPSSNLQKEEEEESVEVEPRTSLLLQEDLDTLRNMTHYYNTLGHTTTYHNHNHNNTQQRPTPDEIKMHRLYLLSLLQKLGVKSELGTAGTAEGVGMREGDREEGVVREEDLQEEGLREGDREEGGVREEDLEGTLESEDLISEPQGSLQVIHDGGALSFPSNLQPLSLDNPHYNILDSPEPFHVDNPQPLSSSSPSPFKPPHSSFNTLQPPEGSAQPLTKQEKQGDIPDTPTTRSPWTSVSRIGLVPAVDFSSEAPADLQNLSPDTTALLLNQFQTQGSPGILTHAFLTRLTPAPPRHHQRLTNAPHPAIDSLLGLNSGKNNPHQDSPRQDSPHQDSPRQDSPRQDSPHQDSPRQDMSADLSHTQTQPNHTQTQPRQPDSNHRDAKHRAPSHHDPVLRPWGDLLPAHPSLPSSWLSLGVTVPRGLTVGSRLPHLHHTSSDQAQVVPVQRPPILGHSQTASGHHHSQTLSQNHMGPDQVIGSVQTSPDQQSHAINKIPRLPAPTQATPDPNQVVAGQVYTVSDPSQESHNMQSPSALKQPPPSLIHQPVTAPGPRPFPDPALSPATPFHHPDPAQTHRLETYPSRTHPTPGPSHRLQMDQTTTPRPQTDPSSNLRHQDPTFSAFKGVPSQPAGGPYTHSRYQLPATFKYPFRDGSGTNPPSPAPSSPVVSQFLRFTPSSAQSLPPSFGSSENSQSSSSHLPSSGSSQFLPLSSASSSLPSSSSHSSSSLSHYLPSSHTRPSSQHLTSSQLSPSSHRLPSSSQSTSSQRLPSSQSPSPSQSISVSQITSSPQHLPSSSSLQSPPLSSSSSRPVAPSTVFNNYHALVETLKIMNEIKKLRHTATGVGQKQATGVEQTRPTQSQSQSPTTYLSSQLIPTPDLYFLNDAAEGASELAPRVTTAVTDLATNIADAISTFFQSIAEAISTFFEDIAMVISETPAVLLLGLIPLFFVLISFFLTMGKGMEMGYVGVGHGGYRGRAGGHTSLHPDKDEIEALARLLLAHIETFEHRLYREL